MIATGVDISRFGRMFMHGQPKTTAEYIQDSSRVGRDSRGPGIVFTLFNPNKPRDKSQYEQFQTYHSRIYSSVEPTSVTPFSIVARERALHAVFVGLIRSFSTDSLRENPTIENTDFKNISKVIKEIILDRVKKINRSEEHTSELQSRGHLVCRLLLEKKNILLTLGVTIFLGPYVSYYKMTKHHLALKKQRQLLYPEMTHDAFGQTACELPGRTHQAEE